jgi:hypothetical protein
MVIISEINLLFPTALHNDNIYCKRGCMKLPATEKCHTSKNVPIPGRAMQQ